MKPQGWLRLSGAMLAISTIAAPVKADDAALAEAFSRMMTQPGDPDAAFEYARVAVAEGQSRAAIAALERVLRINPRLGYIRLELATLYLAVGSPDVAAVYAKEALATPDIPPDDATRARQILASAETSASRSLIQVTIVTGPRWDSNATQATALSAVPIFSPLIGEQVSVNPGVTAQSDGSWVNSVQLTHRYDLGFQTEGAWETNFSVFDQRFFHINHAYDLTVVQFDTGPRIGLGDIGGARISLRPFFSTDYLAYGDRPYATLYGGGLSGLAQLSVRTTVQLTALRRFGNYYDTSFRPLTREYTGPESTVSADGSYAVTPTITLSGGIYYYWADARASFYTRNGPGASASLGWEFPAWEHQVGLTARVGLRRLAYQSPDPFIDPFNKRVDNIYETGLSLTVPLTEQLRLLTQYNYYRQNSSYSIYSFNDNSVSVSLRVGF